MTISDRKQQFIDAFVAARLATMNEITMSGLDKMGPPWYREPTKHVLPRSNFNDSHCVCVLADAENAWKAYSKALGILWIEPEPSNA